MGTITAGSIIDDVATLLFDTNNVEWSRQELLDHLNEAQRAIVTLQPSANYVRSAVQFTQGFIQTLPAGGNLLLDVGVTMGDDGLTPGHAMRQVSRQLQVNVNPEYPIGAEVEEPTEWWFDPQERNTWYVNPPADGNGYVMITYSATPTVITLEATAIQLDDVFQPAIIEYMQFKACGKKVEYARGDRTPTELYASFREMVGAKIVSDMANSPQYNMFPRTLDSEASNS